MVYAKCTNGVCIVVELTVALERTVVTMEYEEKRKSQYTGPDKMLLFRVKIIVVQFVASSVTALGRLKKDEEKEENPIFDPC